MTTSPERFTSTAYRSSIPNQIGFELKSWVGRKLFRAPAPRAPFLHVGCGSNILEGFENVDFFRFRHRPKHFVGLDLRYPLPFPTECFSGAFSEHTLEHLYPDDACRLLSELHRVLKPNSVFRCSVPSLALYVTFYAGGAASTGFDIFKNGCEAMWNLTQNWGHLSVWDANMLRECLLIAGFQQVSERQFREGANPHLLLDMPARQWESLYIEAVR